MAGLLSPRLSLLALALIASGCYQPPASNHATLLVSPSGELTFQGQLVEPSHLQAAIEALAVKGRVLVVEIHASPQAAITLVEESVSKAKAAHAVVAFAATNQ